jgi:catechol 2,3-dioxygenase-like lactoylglutathione lyase family enzyme
MNTTCMAVLKLSVEVITLPVSDVERALRFYVDRVGFTLDVDYSPNDAFRVVQLTPPAPAAQTNSVADSPTRPSDHFAMGDDWPRVFLLRQKS